MKDRRAIESRPTAERDDEERSPPPQDPWSNGKSYLPVGSSKSPTKKKPPHHQQTLLPPLPHAAGVLSVDERQSRQMRSFLQNFLSDDCGHIQDVLDLHQHALDTGITVTDATLQEVVNTVPSVRGLRLTGCSAITDAGLWAIARQCTALDTIYLAGCERLTDLGLRLLAHNCRLVTIDLSDCPQVTDSILQTLAAGCWMLQKFVIQRSNKIGDAGIVKIAQCCKDLRHLDVSECEHVGEYGDKALIEIGKYCSQLRVLDLFGCRHVHDVGVKAIARGCPLLTTLKLTGCQGVSSVALRALAKTCHGLEILSLAGCIKTTNDDLVQLARSCPRIHWLDISGSPNIDATGVRGLAQYCTKLTYLNLSNCQRVNDAALLELAADHASTRVMLTQLAVANCPRITERGVDALTDACSNLLTMDMTDCGQLGRRFLQRLVQKLQFVEWANGFFGFQPLPNAAKLCHLRDRRILETKSAIKLQALMRGCLARGGVWQAKLRYVERKWLPRIQARIRGFLVRKQLKMQAYEHRKRQAAVYISQQYRNWKLRRRLARHRKLLRIRANEDAAAVIFQKIYRGYCGRKRVRMMRDAIQRQKQLAARIHTMLELAAVKVQRAYRGHLGRGDASLLRAAWHANQVRIEQERVAAMLLQRVYRGHKGRQSRAAKMAELLHRKKQQDGAVKMQSVFRGHKARRHAKLLRMDAAQLERLNAAMTIQRYWRGLKDKHLAAVLLGLVKLRVREQDAARAIQRAYRVHASRSFMKAMKLAQQLQRRRLHCAQTIQRMMRGHRGRAQAEVQRELRKLEVFAKPLFQKQHRLEALVTQLGDRVASVQLKLASDEQDEALLTLELDKTMKIKTKYHDSSRITGTPQRYLTQYLQVQLADQLRAKRVELAMATRSLETLVTQWKDAQKQLRGVLRELEPLTVGVVVQTKENRIKRLQAKVRRERVAATAIQKVFRSFRVRCAVREGANCWLQLPVEPSAAAATTTGGKATGMYYYYNTFTGESRWNKPLAMAIFHDDFQQPVALPPPALPTEDATIDMAPAASVSRSQVSCWYEAFDDQVGQSYYYNSMTKEFQWDKPELLSSSSSSLVFLTDTQSSRKRREWLQEQLDDGDPQQLVDGSTLRGQLGEWEHRVDPLSEFFFFYHAPTSELRASLSPRSVHKTLSTSASSSSSSSRRSARSVRTSSPRPMLWQYRYGYQYDEQGQLVPLQSDGGGDTGKVERPIWTEHVDDNSGGAVYYYNHITDEYRWEKPPDFGLYFDAYANTTNSSREWFKLQQQQAQVAEQDNQLGTMETPPGSSSMSSSSSDRGSARSSRALLSERSRQVRELGKKWVECVDDDSGNTYYYNAISGETRWSLSPRSARDTTDVAGEISLALYDQVKRLRDLPVVYTARETHMIWLEDAMDQKDWPKVDVMVQQIQLREQSKIVEDTKRAAAFHHHQEEEKEEQAATDGWILYQDPTTKQSYYYNSITGETSWSDPSAPTYNEVN